LNNKYKFTGQKALCLLVIVIVFTVSGCSNTGNSSNNYANITLDNYNSISYIKYSEVVKIFGREGKLLEAIPSQYNQSVTAYMINNGKVKIIMFYEI
jgi:hypothetical protein